MKPNPTWEIILPSIFLIILGYYMKGFFIINYFIGGAGIILGIYNLIRK
jgi:hypothetical protein